MLKAKGILSVKPNIPEEVTDSQYCLSMHSDQKAVFVNM